MNGCSDLIVDCMNIAAGGSGVAENVEKLSNPGDCGGARHRSKQVPN